MRRMIKICAFWACSNAPFCFTRPISRQSLWSHVYLAHPLSFKWAASKTCLRICAKCIFSDHPVYAQNIIRAFALHSYILLHPIILLANSEDPDQTAQMPSLSVYPRRHAFAWRSLIKVHPVFPDIQFNYLRTVINKQIKKLTNRVWNRKCRIRFHFSFWSISMHFNAFWQLHYKLKG